MLTEKNTGRAFNKVRPIVLQYDSFGFGAASILLSIGRTKVLVSVSLQNGVPRFLKGQKKGWLTAEYAMLPCATQRRTLRESSQVYKNSRSVEISRLIGRTFRSVVNLDMFPEKTIMIDCDVLQADGGTRTACITAAGLALKAAENRWLDVGSIKEPFLKEEVAAISVGLVGDKPCLDLDFYLDSNAEADFNFVVTRSKKLIEVQGTAEKQPIGFEQFAKLQDYALIGINQIFSVIDQSLSGADKSDKKTRPKNAMVSLANRLNS